MKMGPCENVFPGPAVVLDGPACNKCIRLMAPTFFVFL